jgi:GT2 family glycosyltransferase
VISTRNRAHLLRNAVERVACQNTTSDYEVIVVDNNSTDDTAAILAELSRDYPGRVRAAFEPRQGVSYGRNKGIELALAPVVAFTDDDVFVTPDWVDLIARTMATHQEIDGMGGRVLPVWSTPPPAWVTPRHWSPLALVDFGESPFYVDKSRAVCLVTANVAYRRSALDRVGWFSGEFTRCQDHELLLRFWNAGLRALYLPELVVMCEVPSSRLTWAYHQRWHSEHGRFCALMPDATPGEPVDESAPLTLFGAPAAMYRQLLDSGLRFAHATLLRRHAAALDAEATMRHRFAFVVARARSWRLQKRSALTEIARFSVDWAAKRRAAN